jgi:hypothetical protein
MRQTVLSVAFASNLRFVVDGENVRSDEFDDHVRRRLILIQKRPTIFKTLVQEFQQGMGLRGKSLQKG